MSVVGTREQLLPLRALRLDLFQDGDVGVGAFPESEEIFAGSVTFFDMNLAPPSNQTDGPRIGPSVWGFRLELEPQR